MVERAAAETVWPGEPGPAGKPLVTYRLQCFEHEAFVERALRSLLAQTYRPLEILVTDDGSSDGTFDVVRAVARQYAGPHRLLLYRGERNRDILAHCNDALHLIGGEFFIWFSGDDVADPDQAEQLVSAWLESGAAGVWSNHRMIDQDDRELGLVLSDGHPYTLDLCDYADGRFLDFPYSGTCGYSREVIDRFGPVPAHLGSRGLEHHFGFRAALLGPKRLLNRPLMSRRHHPQRRTHGEGARDRADDPMVVHERQIRVRLQVLVGCRDVIADTQGTPHDPAHEWIAQSLSRQIAHEARRLLECEAFRQRRSRAADPAAAEFQHSGLLYKPNVITFVRPLPEYQMNLIAGECKYLAVPCRLGATEPCGHRTDAYPGVVSAWSESELFALLASRAQRLEIE